MEKTRPNVVWLFPKTAEKFQISELKTKRKECVESPPRVVELLRCEIHFCCSVPTFVGDDEIPELLLTKPNGEYLMEPLALVQGLLSPRLRVVGTLDEKWF